MTDQTTTGSSRVKRGLAEMLKHGIIADAGYFEAMQRWAQEGRADPQGPKAVFFFQAFDEPWKQGDDGWGLFNTRREARYTVQSLGTCGVTWTCEAGSYTTADAVKWVPPTQSPAVTATRYTLFADTAGADEQQGLALFSGQKADTVAHGEQVERDAAVISGRRDGIHRLFQQRQGTPAAAHVRDVHIAQDRPAPGLEVCTGFEPVLRAPGIQQCILHQIVSQRRALGQPESVTAKLRHRACQFFTKMLRFRRDRWHGRKDAEILWRERQSRRTGLHAGRPYDCGFQHRPGSEIKCAHGECILQLCARTPKRPACRDNRRRIRGLNGTPESIENADPD